MNILPAPDAQLDLVAPAQAPSSALWAPLPPAEGELLPTATGWLLSVTPVDRRLYPRAARWIPPFANIGCLFSIVMSALDLYLGFLLSLAVAAPPFFLCFFGPLLVARRTLRRVLARAPQPPRIFEVRAGSFVRVSGAVCPGPSVPSLFQGRPAVLFRNAFAGADETRGIDFSIVMADGTRLSVSVRDAFLIGEPEVCRGELAGGPMKTLFTRGVSRLVGADRPQGTLGRLFRGRYRETAIGPGDQVEICGVLHRDPAPDGEAPPGRHTPMRLVLRGEPGRPLVVRKAPRDG